MTLLAAVDWHSVFFMVFGLTACVFALGVLFSNNIVRMAFYLVLSLGSTAGLFFLAGAEFVGAMQLLIYVGGTLVLLVFGVMLTAQRPFISMKTTGGEWIVAAIVGSALLLLLLRAAFSVDDWRAPREDRQQIALAEEKAITTQLGLALVGVRADKLEQPDEELRTGMSGYLLPFELIGIHLLVVLIGAAYLARTQRRASRQAPSPASPGPLS